MLEIPGQAADRAGLALEIEHQHVAFGRRIEFEDQRDAKARLEFFPDVGTQAVAAGEPQLVFGLVRLRRRIDQIAAQLADILHHRAIVVDDIVPELAHRKALADIDRSAGDQQRADRAEPARGVVHRQAHIVAVGCARAHHAGKAETGEHDAVVVDVRRLRHAGGAGGVDVERVVLDGERRSLALAAALRRTKPRSRGRCAARNCCFRRAARLSAILSDAGARCRTGRASSAATITCFGETMLMQCASEGPIRLVLSKRGNAADAGDAEPDRHEFRPVRHQQADGLALGELLVQRPARIAVRALVQLAIAEGLVAATAGPACRRACAASSSITFGKMRAGLRAICVVIRSARSAPQTENNMASAASRRNPYPAPMGRQSTIEESRDAVSRDG